MKAFNDALLLSFITRKIDFPYLVVFIISNSFNEYFVNVGRLMSEDIDCDTNPLHYVQNNLNSMCIHEITAAEVMTVISTLNNSAAGHDGIPAFIMKQCIN